MRRRTLIASGLGLGAGLPALAQGGFPNRPIRIVIPAGPGGGTDILARLVTPKAAALLGTSIVIENRGGGESLIGTEVVVRAPADGHVLLFSDSSPYMARVLRERMPFDPLTELAPVMRVATGSVLLYAHPGFGARDIAGLVARARAEPGRVTFATSSTVSQLIGELLKQRAGFDMTHVPYRSGGQALTDVVSGHVNLTVNGASNGKPYVQSGELVALGTAGTARNPALPDVPSFAEQGYPGIPGGSEWCLLAPAGTPQPVIDQLHAAFREAAFDAGLAPRMAELGFIPDGMAGGPFLQEKARELQLWAQVLAATGIARR
ncbi:Bug family tripartite tricarboxylate transporter substrate binding protein [Falsiroseomonas oryzae]|uniref:Bug family tripartite tricarboxylate transporter substrate binding protein n=1 Tax=Falsiroseomonas oryzae TaxID=2766473 RepID=UPI0022EA19F5|nr:tripartite tricarboxylate transporter substrate binding protein [Roseomonas sp. MO-31]